MNILLKWYYWYKNFWDELLLFWVLNFLNKNFETKNIFIQAWDKNWLNYWLQKNEKYLSKKNYICIEKNEKPNFDLLVIWWGDGFSAKFPHNWFNYILKHFSKIKSWNFVILGWISTPIWFQNKIYNFILPRAKKIILREKWSLELAKKYNERSYLYEDFAFESLVSWSKNNVDINVDKGKYVVYNVNKYVENPETINSCKDFYEKYKNFDQVYMPFDINYNDQKYYQILKQYIPNLKFYDWTQHSLDESIKFLACSKAWIWARLHFLIVMKYFWKDFFPFVYQEKVQKFLDLKFYNTHEKIVKLENTKRIMKML